MLIRRQRSFILFLPAFLAMLFNHPAFALEMEVDPQKYILSGFIKDQTNGELLVGATVYITELQMGVVTNPYGFYSISLTPGTYTVRYSYLGFKEQERRMQTNKNISLDIFLLPAPAQLGEVVVKGNSAGQDVFAPEMSIVKMDTKTIRKIPALLGETDLIKVIQLLPGVQTTSEGTSGFSVRGGNADQNLIILDEATVYNASHLMGFFSIFNNDAVKDVTLYKGDIPAAYGGRLSSLLDVRMRDGNAKKFAATGSLGTVSSKLTLEGPLVKDRTTFLLSGRRTYADLFLPLARNEDIQDNRLYFYDLNLKMTHQINNNNRLYLSGYSGRDIFKNKFAFMGFGNQTGSWRWNHLLSRKLFFNLSLIYSRFSYDLGTGEEEENRYRWTSLLRNYSIRADFTHYLSVSHTLQYGFTNMYFQFFPGTIRNEGKPNLVPRYELPAEYAFEHGIYGSDEFMISERLTLKTGLRLAIFQNTGPGTYYNYDLSYNPVDSIRYGKGEIFNTYTRLEPRLGLTFVINPSSSVKGSFSHTTQFLMLAQNSSAGTPLDVWFPATNHVKPQICDQMAVGYFRNEGHKFEISAETYFKNFRQVIDFKDHAQLLLNKYLEGELRFGTGISYGIEVMWRKNEGRLTGWISYTYSRSFRTIPGINNGKRYNAPFDKPHNINLVANYDLSKRVSSSLTWIYATGLPVTFPTGRAIIGNAIIPVYSDRNEYRMEDYHRMDVSVSIKGKNRPGKKWQGEWNFSVCNLYDRHNTWSINFVSDEAHPNTTYAEKTYLFSVIPAVTYNFKF